MAPKLEEKARTGRDNQRYGAQGERLVAGVVPISADKRKVLLIQSTRRNGWVIPKGGWEMDEQTAEDAACREAWEEAGIVCKIQKDLGKIPDKRGPEELTAHAPRAVFQFFEVMVEKEETKWPEMHKRDRKWMSYAEAKSALAARPELLEALNRSSIRKSDGVKLGQVCAKDLLKRIPPALGSKAAIRDPVVELDVSSKILRDDGFAELARGIIQTYHANCERHTVLKLEEINLKDNRLSPLSLLQLSEIIRLACSDIRDLDISNNDLRLESSGDIAAWESFLRALSGCCMLRRLDLSNNALGSKAFEVLARVYGQEDPVDLATISSNGRLPMGGSGEEVTKLEACTREWNIECPEENQKGWDATNHGEEQRGPRRASKESEKAGSTRFEPLPLSTYRKAMGLRSVPYIILSNSLTDDTSALHLSYILTNHHFPQRLMSCVPPAKAGAPAQQLSAYDAETRCRGIIYLPNSSCSNAAFKALELAERAREGHGNQVRVNKPTSEDADLDGMSTEPSARPQLSPTSVPGHSRRSSAFTSSEGLDAIAMESHRARSRLQLTTIESAGHQSNDLWRAAVKMLVVCRVIQPQATKVLPPQPPNQVAPPPKPKLSIVRTLDVSGITPKETNPWGIPLAPKSTNMSMSPRPKPRKQSVAAAYSVAPASTGGSMQPYQRKPSLPSSRYKTDLPLGFTSDIWSRILGFTTGAEGILSHRQQQSVLRYAMDRGSLRKERQALGLKVAVRKWHLLEDMGCLAYEVR